jgi:aspartate racemase
MKTLGILGGMGHYATLQFYNKILEYDKVNNDFQRIPCIIDIQTDIPSRTLVAMGKENENILIANSIFHINYLCAKADIICTPCNSFHYFRNKIIEQTFFNVIWPDMVEIVSKELLSKEYNKPLILGGWIVNNKQNEMYGKYFPEAVYLNEKEQDHINRCIEYIKQNKQVDFDNFLSHYYWANKDKYDCILLACTELTSNLFQYKQVEYFDSSFIYAKEIVKLCKET